MRPTLRKTLYGGLAALVGAVGIAVPASADGAAPAITAAQAGSTITVDIAPGASDTITNPYQFSTDGGATWAPRTDMASVDTRLATGAGFAGGSPAAAAVLPDGRTVVVGDFTTYNGAAAPGIAVINRDGTLDATFDPGAGFAGGDPWDVAVDAVNDPAAIYVAGTFTTYDGADSTGLVRINLDGSTDTGFVVGNGFNEAVRVIEVRKNGDVVVAGAFSDYDNASVPPVVRLNVDGTVDGGFTYPDADIIEDLDFSPAGGSFWALKNDGLGGNEVVRYTGSGAFDVAAGAFTFQGGNANLTRITAAADGGVYVAGEFDDYDGTAVSGLVRLESDGTLDATFDPDTTGWVEVADMDLDAMGNLLVAVGTASAVVVDALSPDSGAPAAGFNPAGTTNAIEWIAIAETDHDADNALDGDGSIVVVGDFTTFFGAPAAGIVRLHGNGPRLLITAASADAAGIVANPQPLPYRIQVRNGSSGDPSNTVVKPPYTAPTAGAIGQTLTFETDAFAPGSDNVVVRIAKTGQTQKVDVAVTAEQFEIGADGYARVNVTIPETTYLGDVIVEIAEDGDPNNPVATFPVNIKTPEPVFTPASGQIKPGGEFSFTIWTGERNAPYEAFLVKGTTAPTGLPADRITLTNTQTPPTTEDIAGGRIVANLTLPADIEGGDYTLAVAVNPASESPTIAYTCQIKVTATPQADLLIKKALRGATFQTGVGDDGMVFYARPYTPAPAEGEAQATPPAFAVGDVTLNTGGTYEFVVDPVDFTADKYVLVGIDTSQVEGTLNEVIAGGMIDQILAGETLLSIPFAVFMQIENAAGEVKAGVPFEVAEITGATPNGEVQYWLFSDPVLLATATANDAGVVAPLAVTIPDTVPAGVHTLAVIDSTSFDLNNLTPITLADLGTRAGVLYVLGVNVDAADTTPDTTIPPGVTPDGGPESTDDGAGAGTLPVTGGPVVLALLGAAVAAVGGSAWWWSRRRLAADATS